MKQGINIEVHRHINLLAFHVEKYGNAIKNGFQENFAYNGKGIIKKSDQNQKNNEYRLVNSHL